MSHDGLFRLVFTLPPRLRLCVRIGRHQPCIHGCVLIIDTDLKVSIEGPSREMIFNQARRFLRIATKGHQSFVIAATLYTPARELHRVDTWHIAIGAEVVIAATAVAPDIGVAPQLTSTRQAG